MGIQTLADELFVDVNDSFLQMTGHRGEEVRGRPAQNLHLFADLADQARLLGWLRQNQPVRLQECRLLTKSGTLRDALISMELLALGDQPHLLFIAQDITDRINLEHQLRQAQKMEAVGQLAAGVAHDFNNIMTVIQGYASLALADGHLENEVAQSLEAISCAADRAAALVRQLLAFSRKQVIQRVILDVNVTLQGFGRMLGRLIGEHISIHWDLAPDLPHVLADIRCLEQVMMNLAVNARDAMPGGGQLRISTTKTVVDPSALLASPDRKPGRYVCVSVEDTGQGMKTEVQNRVFEPFFTTKDVGKGTGLGLATAYGILKQHGGWIEVSSEVGRGAVFRFYLPSTSQPLRAGRPTDAASLSSTGGAPRTILLVEDESPVLDAVSKILRAQGWVVHAASSSAEALKVWDEHAGKFDLLLTDMVMPGGISGLVLADTLLARRPDLPVIYMSGYSLNLANEGLTTKKGIAFLQKPFGPAQLQQAICKCLGQGHADACSLGN